MLSVAGIIFDFDGTLTQPAALDFDELRRAVGCPAEETLLEHLAGLPPAERQAAAARLEAVELQAARLAQPNDGAVEVLAELRAAGWPLAVLTRNTRASILASLANFPPWAADLLAVIISRDEAIPPKPDPAGVRLAAQRLGLPPAALVVVGDFRYDIEAGLAAGARTVYLTNGDGPPPASLTPHHVIRYLTELPPLLPPAPRR